MKTPEHIWRTADGRHVPHGHPDAAILAYPAGDEVPDGLVVEGAAEPEPPKAAPKAANKSRARAEDK